MGKIYQNENQLMLEELIKIYKPVDYDWLSYQITKKNVLTLHHIIKVANKGSLSVNNLALLTKRAHRALNICEHKDYILYSEINDFFRYIISLSSFEDEYLKNESRNYKKALVKTLYK